MSTGVAWFVLFIAGLCEVGWAVGLKYTEGFSRLGPSLATLAAMALSVVLLGWSLKVLPLGTAYAVWTGIGAVGTAILGIFLFGESRETLRFVSIGLIVAGIVGLKLVTPDSHQEQRRQAEKDEKAARIGQGGDHHRTANGGIGTEFLTQQRNADPRRGGKQQVEDHRCRHHQP